MAVCRCTCFKTNCTSSCTFISYLSLPIGIFFVVPGFRCTILSFLYVARPSTILVAVCSCYLLLFLKATCGCSCNVAVLTFCLWRLPVRLLIACWFIFVCKCFLFFHLCFLFCACFKATCTSNSTIFAVPVSRQAPLNLTRLSCCSSFNRFNSSINDLKTKILMQDYIREDLYNLSFPSLPHSLRLVTQASNDFL